MCNLERTGSFSVLFNLELQRKNHNGLPLLRLEVSTSDWKQSVRMFVVALIKRKDDRFGIQVKTHKKSDRLKWIRAKLSLTANTNERTALAHRSHSAPALNCT